MEKHVHWQEDIKDPEIKRSCECQGCGKCCSRIVSLKSNSCGTFGSFKCEECKEWRCKSCMLVSICRYCKRI